MVMNSCPFVGAWTPAELRERSRQFFLGAFTIE